MRVDTIAGSAIPYSGPRPEASSAPLPAGPAPKIQPVPADAGSQKSPEDAVQSNDHGPIAQLMAAMNEKLLRVNRRMVLYEVAGTHEIAAKIVNATTNEVVEFIPPEALLKLRARLHEMKGVVVDKGA